MARVSELPSSDHESDYVTEVEEDAVEQVDRDASATFSDPDTDMEEDEEDGDEGNYDPSKETLWQRLAALEVGFGVK